MKKPQRIDTQSYDTGINTTSEFVTTLKNSKSCTLVLTTKKSAEKPRNSLKVELIRADITGNLYSVDILMTRKEAADFIGRTVKSVDRLCRERKIRKVFVNGQPRIRKSELLLFKGIDIVEEKPEGAMSELDKIISRFK